MNLLKNKPYLAFIFPGFVLYTLFVIYPIAASFTVSLSQWSGIGPKTFVGFGNYVELFTNTTFFNQLVNALKHNATILILQLVVVLPLQIYMAYLIYNRIHGHNFFQVMIYAPHFIVSAVTVVIFKLIFDGNVGVFNKLLALINLGEYQKPWLGVPEYGIYIVWMIGAWSGIGFGMLFFTGAMKMLPKDTIESAKIDGAGFWLILFRIIIPQIKITILNIIILTYIFSMTVFDYSYLLAGATGSAGIKNCYDVMTLFFYRIAFGNLGEMGGTLEVNSIGMGTTIACVLFGIIMIVAFVQLKFAYKRTEADN